MKKRLIAIGLCLFAGALGGFVIGPVIYSHAIQPAQKPAAVVKELTSYRDIVKHVLPAVVSIDAVRVVKNGGQPQRQIPGFDNKDLPEEFRRFFEEFRGKRSPNLQTPERSTKGFGSGFVVDPDGVIMTNFHVVTGASKVTIKFSDGRKYTSKDIRGDRRTDLAIIKIDTKGKKLPYLQLGDSDTMEIGDRVLAFGAPFGLTGTVTQGIISAKGRSGLNMNMYEDFLQTDAAINPGNSGGPLVNLEGKVIGINAAIKSRSGGFNGVGLAVASKLAKGVKQALLKDGVVRRGYLGVQVTEPEREVRNRLGLADKEGVVVGKVFDDTPASKAGIKSGDIITKVNATVIANGKQLQLIVADLPLKKAASVEILRNGKRQTLKVTIEEQPEQYGLNTVPVQRAPSGDASGTNLEKIGVEVVDLTAAVAKQLGYSADVRGVVISKVNPGGLASSVGLQRGMLIVKVDNQPVASAEAARQAISSSSIQRGVLLQVRSPQGGTNYVLLQSRGG